MTLYKIKPLIWYHYSWTGIAPTSTCKDFWSCDTEVGTYHIREDSDGKWYWAFVRNSYADKYPCKDYNDGKRHARKDYKERMEKMLVKVKT